jgi:hypothetical protein
MRYANVIYSSTLYASGFAFAPFFGSMSDLVGYMLAFAEKLSLYGSA